MKVAYFRGHVCRMKVDEIKAFMKRFCSMDRDMDGFISADDMSQYLGVPKDVCLQAVFDAFELVSNEGTLS